MYINKTNFNEIIARWIKNDAQLWACLTTAEIKILHQRITKEFSFQKIAEELDATETMIERMFTQIIEKITKEVDHEIAVELFIIHKKLENPPMREALNFPDFQDGQLN